MTNKEFQKLLQGYPDDMLIKLNISDRIHGSTIHGSFIKNFEDENIMLTSDTAYNNQNAPEDEWDNEDGKVMLGDGIPYLLLNPIII